jgi:uncharacterized protein (TIGR00290 family)
MIGIKWDAMGSHSTISHEKSRDTNSFMTKLAFVSWSGGKDSALALHRARALGLEVRAVLTMLEETGQRSRSHAVPLAVMQAQADAMGIELVTACACWADYESVFIATAKSLAARGFTHGVFGDIDLQAHRDWEEKVCAAAGVTPVLPLWHNARSDVAKAVLDLGFRAKIVCVNGRYLDESFCGREYDQAFVDSLPTGVDLCGENGEFHTFVYDGPIFHRPATVHVAKRHTYSAPANQGGDTFYFAELSM